MKPLYSLLMITVFSLMIESCAKEEENKTTTVTPLNCQLISKQVGSEKMVYEYVNGNIKTISGYLSVSPNPVEVYTYTYNGQTITYTNKSGREKGTITLDDKGNALSHDITFYSGQDTSEATSMTLQGFTYDNAGYLIKMSRTLASSSGNSSSSRVYEWKDGNLYSTKLISSIGDTLSKDVYTYYTDKQNTFADFFRKTKFTGNQSKNLLKEITDHSNASPQVIETYTYQFDEKGLPVKTIINRMGNVTEETNAFQCSN